MKKKGFTLVELLAVIIILSVIAFIAIPQVLKLISDSEKKSFQDTAYGIIEAANYYYASNALKENKKEIEITYPDDKTLDLKGKKPDKGSVLIDLDGKISMAVSNKKWCAIKEKDSDDINVIKYEEDTCIVEGMEKSTSTKYFTVEENSNSTIDITAYSDEGPKEVIIPEKINGKLVTSIKANAFKSKKLTSVEIPNTVTTIEASAFQSNRLISMAIPNSVTNIGEKAFFNNSIKNLSIPNSIKTISNSAFSSNKLQSVVIPNSVKTIGPHAFASNKLQSVTIPNSVTSIGQYAFSGNQLTSIVIPNSVASIDENTFSNNLAGMKVTVNKSIDSITGSPWGAASVEWTG